MGTHFLRGKLDCFSSKTMVALLAFSLMAGGAMVLEPQVAMARMPLSAPDTFSPNLIADVAENVAPSVVNIDVEKTARAVTAPNLSGLPFSDEILKRFFGFDSEQAPFTPFGSKAAPSQTIASNGSGMILNKEGFILTNNHVVASADKITVTLNDGRQLPARLVGRDAYSDIAVLKVESPNLSPVALGDSDTLRPGEWVIAVGSPLGFDHTVTQGIVSALSRRIPDLNSNLSFIQTDAAINPGNSGGPLVNLKGEVIGINTAISGKGQNIGFAIPINTVKEIANTLIAGKTITRPWLGIGMVPLNPDLAQHIGLPAETKGVVVSQIMENSPAYKAGLMQGDVLQKIDGKPITKPELIQETVRAKPMYSKVALQILRNGHPIEVSLTSEPLPDSGELSSEMMTPPSMHPRVIPPQSKKQSRLR